MKRGKVFTAKNMKASADKTARKIKSKTEQFKKKVKFV